MEADYGIQIQEKGKLIVPKNDAYNFGKDDFTITILFQTTQPGTLISRKSTEGGSPDCAGWLLVLKPNGVFKMATDNGSGFYEVNSEPTGALDGTWHSVAAIRKNGMISIFFDGDQISVTPRSSLPTPLDVSNELQIVIGDCDQQQEPYRQFVGLLEDVSIWNRALNQYEIRRTMFNKVTPEDSGLIGYWELNQNFDDTSQINNPIIPIGPVSWMPIFHCVWAEAANDYSYCAIDLHENIITDYGAEINNGGMITLPTNNAYNFGTGDFTISALFQTTQPGTIISRKSTEGGSPDCAGWLLVLKPNGVFKIATDNGFGFYEVNSEPTSALDGKWHSVAAIRKSGAITIFFDGLLLSVTPNSSLPSPLNISNSRRIVIGNCDQQQELYRQFVGVVEDVTIWNRALSEADIQRTRFNEVTPSDPGLVGFWQMDQNFNDDSPIKNNGSFLGAVQFVEVAHHAKRHQSLMIKSGTSYLYGAVIDKSKNDVSFPEDALVQVFRPDGTQLNQESNTDDLFVHMNGNSVWTFTVKNPQAGDWRFHVECPTSVPILLSIQTTPTQDVAPTIGNALQELYGEVPASHARILLAKRGTEALALFSWSWCNVAKWAGFTLATVALVVAVVVVGVVGVIAPPVLIGTAVALGVGATLFTIGDIASKSLQVADEIGLVKQTFGGTAQGEFSFLIDGQEYFPLLRNLLLAVQSGHYNDQITAPENQTFEDLIKGISRADKKAYILLWNQTFVDILSRADSKIMGFLRYYKHFFDGLGRNYETYKALKDLKNVDVCLQKYTASAYPPVSQHWPSYFLNLNSIHQKIVVVSVNNVKCALVGGFNIITPEYWDDADHPMHPDSTGYRNYHTWHDCAVLLRGPVVDLVENEFNRRWKQTGLNATVLNQGTYAKIACWEVDHKSRLDSHNVCGEHQPLTIHYKDPSKSDLQDTVDVDVDVMITTAEFSDPVTQVRQKLLKLIEDAQNYIYFENFTFSDVELVKAINKKLKNISTRQDFRCIILIPHPITDKGDQIQEVQYYMCRMAFSAMLLYIDEWDCVEFKGERKLYRYEVLTFDVNIPDDKPIEYATFTFQLKLSGDFGVYSIINITHVEPAHNSRLIFTSPVRRFAKGVLPDTEDQKKYQLPGLSKDLRKIYVHSKVALVDDKYVLVGSANFNTRSLRWDEECSVGCSSSTKAKEIRNKIFNHWGVDTAQNWKAIMTDFAQSEKEGVGVIPLSINQLEPEIPSFLPRMFESIIDPSDWS